MRTLLALSAAAALLGCAGPQDGPGTESAARFTRFAQIPDVVPGFRGLGRLDDVWIVYTRSASELEEAEAQLEALFGRFSGDRFVVSVRPERGSASEELKVQARDVLSVPSAVMLDYDELTGYLRIGVSDPEVIREVEAALREAAVPVDEAILQVHPPMVAH